MRSLMMVLVLLCYTELVGMVDPTDEIVVILNEVDEGLLEVLS